MPEPEYTLKRQSTFDAQLANAVPHMEVREGIEASYRFYLQSCPYQGRATGRAEPFPVYALSFAGVRGGERVVIFYCIYDKTVLLLDARLAEDEPI